MAAPYLDFDVAGCDATTPMQRDCLGRYQRRSALTRLRRKELELGDAGQKCQCSAAFVKEKLMGSLTATEWARITRRG